MSIYKINPYNEITILFPPEDSIFDWLIENKIIGVNKSKYYDSSLMLQTLSEYTGLFPDKNYIFHYLTLFMSTTITFVELFYNRKNFTTIETLDSIEQKIKTDAAEITKYEATESWTKKDVAILRNFFAIITLVTDITKIEINHKNKISKIVPKLANYENIDTTILAHIPLSNNLILLLRCEIMLSLVLDGLYNDIPKVINTFIQGCDNCSSKNNKLIEQIWGGIRALIAKFICAGDSNTARDIVFTLQPYKYLKSCKIKQYPVCKEISELRVAMDRAPSVVSQKNLKSPGKFISSCSKIGLILLCQIATFFLGRLALPELSILFIALLQLTAFFIVSLPAVKFLTPSNRPFPQTAIAQSNVTPSPLQFQHAEKKQPKPQTAPGANSMFQNTASTNQKQRSQQKDQESHFEFQGAKPKR